MVYPIAFENPWLVSVDGARRRTPGFVALLIALVVLPVSLLGGGALYGALPDVAAAIGPGELGQAADRLVLYICVLGLLYGVALGGLMVEHRGPSHRAGGQALAIPLGLATGVIGFLAAVGLVALLGAVRPGADASFLDHKVLGAAIGAGLIAFQASGEEVFFRAWLQPLLGARWGAWVGLMATSILFGLAHSLNRAVSPLAILNDIMAGAVFGALALRTGGLWAPILAHWGWNWTEQSVLGLSPNPGVDSLGSLFDLDLVGPSLLSGGHDEMNGSIAATAVLALILVLLRVWRPKPGQAKA